MSLVWKCQRLNEFVQVMTNIISPRAAHKQPLIARANASDVNGNWEIEEALDIERAHAIAPRANIVLVEATTDSNADLFNGITTWDQGDLKVASATRNSAEKMSPSHLPISSTRHTMSSVARVSRRSCP